MRRSSRSSRSRSWSEHCSTLACSARWHRGSCASSATASCRRCGTSTTLFLLVFYSATWLIGGAALWLLLRSVGAHPEASSIVFLGGTAAVGAIVAVLSVFAPSGLGPREASMYGLMLAVAGPGAALGATVLNRVAITVVEVLLLVVGGLVLRRGEDDDEDQASVRLTASTQPATSADTSRSGS